MDIGQYIWMKNLACFQPKMDQVLEDCEGAIGISVDICVYGRITAEHDRNPRKTMDTARKYDLVFNKDKCKIRQELIKFYDLIWDKDGSHPDQENATGSNQNRNQQTEKNSSNS